MNSKVIGIAPLYLSDGKAFFLGSSNVFDYLDFIIAPGLENDFFNILLNELKSKNVNRMELELVRENSSVLKNLINFARANEYQVTLNEKDVLLEMDLSGSWEKYLSSLTSRHRHELRRKFRRFQEAGLTNFQMIENPEKISGFLDLFFKFFRENRDDKEVFMTFRMERFFRSLVDVMVKAQLLRLGILELDERPVAFVICLDDKETLYLYNNSFDPKYRNLNLGFVSKAFSVKHGINLGKKMFNFLKGDERYKYHLGGKKVLLYSFKISL
ncbi:MAG: GNAT family N-acetyltransferase [Candidatus Bathyarchaeota archaeon]|nr:GNAT family N-acetyltransferase [Candidatus Bathyarchaeota archaeon]